MVVPIEDVWLPRCIKQELLNRHCYLFPPDDLTIFHSACEKHGLPPAEAYKLIEDCTKPIGIRYIGQALTSCPLDRASQYCHKSCVDFLIDNPHNSAVYIDSEGSFSPVLLTRFGATEVMLDRISVLRIMTVEELLSACHISVFNKKDALVVVDSISSIIRHSNPELIRKTLRSLSRILAGRRCIVVNQTTTDMESGELVPCFRRLFEKYFTKPNWTQLTLRNP